MIKGIGIGIIKRTVKNVLIPAGIALKVCALFCSRSSYLTQWNMVGARIKIMWEEQLVDPPNEYITPVNVP